MQNTWGGARGHMAWLVCATVHAARHQGVRGSAAWRASIAWHVMAYPPSGENNNTKQPSGEERITALHGALHDVDNGVNSTVKS